MNTIKTLTSLLLIFSAIFLTGCFQGYVGADGEPLKEYLQPSALKVLTENPDEDIWIIDVRPDSAYALGHIPTAQSYPSSVIGDLAEAGTLLNEFPLDQYLIIYCETGIRAQAVVRLLEDEGYTRLMNWGGISRWPYTKDTNLY